jgi:hypothetical protein
MSLYFKLEQEFMKSPIDSGTMRDMKANMYIKKTATYLKKAKEKGLSEIPCVVIESHDYSCGGNYAFTFYGSQSQVNKFFKELQKEKKNDKSLAFAKGVCRLSDGAGGKLELDFALKGFIKPDQVKKNKKKLFMKMGVTLKDVVKGSLDEVNDVVDSISSEGTQDVIDEDSPEGTQDAKVDKKSSKKDDGKSMLVSAKKYAKADEKMKQIILPLLKSKTGVVYTQTHVEIAKAAYTNLTNFLDACANKESEKSTVLDKKPKIKALRDAILDNSLKEKYLKIWNKVKLEYKKEVDNLKKRAENNEEVGSFTDEEQTKISRVEALLKEIKAEEAQQS